VRSLKSISVIAAGAVFAAGTVLIAGPAIADPVNSHLKKVTPQYYDVVGVGSDTDDTLFDQLAFDYNSAHKVHNKNHPYIYSFDAVPPSNPLNATSVIKPKSGCSAKTPRPDGSGAGITQFELPAKTRGHHCIDFARSASYRPTSARSGQRVGSWCSTTGPTATTRRMASRPSGMRRTVPVRGRRRASRKTWPASWSPDTSRRARSTRCERPA